MTQMTDTIKRACAVAGAVAIAYLFFVSLSSSAAGGKVPLAAADGAATYKAKCAMCHAADGSGNTPAGKNLKVRDLRSAEVQGMSDDALYNIISKGKGKMPAYGASLGADTCRALVAYVRKLKG